MHAALDAVRDEREGVSQSRAACAAYERARLERLEAPANSAHSERFDTFDAYRVFVDARERSLSLDFFRSRSLESVRARCVKPAARWCPFPTLFCAFFQLLFLKYVCDSRVRVFEMKRAPSS